MVSSLYKRNWLLQMIRFHCFASRREGPPDPCVCVAALRIVSCVMLSKCACDTCSWRGPWIKLFEEIPAASGCRFRSLLTTSGVDLWTELEALSSRNFNAAPTFPSNISLEKILVMSSGDRCSFETSFLCMIWPAFRSSRNFPSFHSWMHCSRCLV